MEGTSSRKDRRDNWLLAARGTAGQLLLCSVLVWRAAPRTVTVPTHTHINTHANTNVLTHVYTRPHALADDCMLTYKQITKQMRRGSNFHFDRAKKEQRLRDERKYDIKNQ